MNELPVFPMADPGITRDRRAKYRRRTDSSNHDLFADQTAHYRFPPTRYQGSKLKLLDWIWESIEHLDFETALDLFGGTACVAYLLKTKGKQVRCNDSLRANYLIARALIENRSATLSQDDISHILRQDKHVQYKRFIEFTFKNVYFKDHENRWLDVVAQNIARMPDEYKKALAYFAVFQACIAKRPYNLFHRANLYIRTANVRRSFGNKATWERSFEDHFRRAADQANSAVFDNGRQNTASNLHCLEVPTGVDLVYVDTPYMNSKGVGVDYLDFYHFLEGLTEYDVWPDRITTGYKHKPYKRVVTPWCDRELIHKAFDGVLARFSASILVVSYRDNGIPTPEEIIAMLKRYKHRVRMANHTEYKYVLSKSRSRELLFIAE